MLVAVAERGRGSSRAFLAYLFLFPGFLLYHFLVGTGRIPAALGGFFTPMVVVFSAVTVTTWPDVFRLQGRNAHVLLPFLLFVGIVALVTVLGRISSVPDTRPVDVFGQSVRFVAQCLLMFVIGARLDLTSRSRYWLLAGFLFVVAWIVGSNLAAEGLRFAYLAQTVDPERVASYQGVARSVFYTAILVIAFSRPYFVKLAIALLALVVLFLVGARSEFVGMAVVAGLVSLIGGWRGAVTIIGVVLLLAIVIGFVQELVPDHRVLRLFDLAADRSYSERQAMRSLGLAAIGRHFLLGDYGGQMNTTGQTGTYIHDMLSAWRQFGLLTFLAYVWLLGYGSFSSIRGFFSARSSIGEACMYICVSALVLALVAKSVFWFMPALGWGMLNRLHGESSTQTVVQTTRGPHAVDPE